MDIDMSLVMDNSKYVAPLKEAQQANQNFYTQDQKYKKRELGLIEDIEQELSRLEAARKKSHNPKQIEAYNKKIAEGQRDLKEYNKLGLENTKVVEKQGSKFEQLAMVWGKVLVAAAAVWATLKTGKEIMESTGRGADTMEAFISGAKSAFDRLKVSVATMDFKDFGVKLQTAYREGKRYERALDLEDDEMRAMRQKIEMNEVLITNDRIIQITGNTADEKIKAGERVMNYEKKNEKLRAEWQTKSYDNELTHLAQIANAGKTVTDEMRQEIRLYSLRDEAFMEMLTKGEEYNKRKAEISKLEDITNPFSSSGISYSEQQIEQFKKDIKELTTLQTEEGKLASELLARVTTPLDPDYQKLADKSVALIQAQNSANQGTLRVRTKIHAAEEEKIKDLKKEEEAQKKAYEKLLEYLSKIEALQNKNRESEIANLSGIPQINAQEAYEQESLDKTEQFLIKEFKLNVKSIEEIQRAKELVALKAEEKRRALLLEWDSYESVDHKKANEKIFAEDLKAYEEQALAEMDLLKASEEDKLKFLIDFNVQKLDALSIGTNGKLTPEQEAIINNIKLLKAELASIYDDRSLAGKVLGWMGFADDQIQPIIDAAQSVFDSIKQITDQRVEDAERQTDILNQRIEEEQNALETEKDLMEKGFASNVRAKANEIELLKQQRDKALKEEEKARKIQNALDTATQVSNLVTATSSIIKTFAKAGPLGIILGSIAIGLMFSTFLAAKIQARKAAQLAEGGSGTVKGKRHSEGGEAFLNHVEVEDGEAWGVLSRGATAKYGNEFHQVIKAFNKGDIKKFRAQPNLKPVINISSDLSEKRLSSIEREMKQLNKHFTDNGERTELADRTIIRKNHHTRVIRKR
jgi:hypothetical protein